MEIDEGREEAATIFNETFVQRFDDDDDSTSGGQKDKHADDIRVSGRVTVVQ